jgi:MoaA/NifB/PqqE/SkfB family radical SAM enzyme
MSHYSYYRAKWTCGRFHKEKQVAIIYNLISSDCFYFEDYSAIVIDEILHTPRTAVIQIDEILKKINISKDELLSFLDVLQNYGLLSPVFPDAQIETMYRNYIVEMRRNQSDNSYNATRERQIDVSDAEKLYFDAVQPYGVATSIMFELTYRCSERCIHCYNPGATRNVNEQCTRGRFQELNIDDYKKIIDELCEQGLVKACLTGGDPFSHSDAWEIIDYLYQKGVATDIYTNGQSIYKQADRLASYYPRTVGISIYSSSPKIHDSITNIDGSWEKSMSLIEQLSTLGVPMYLKCCVMRPNVKTYRGVAEIAHKYGAQPQFELNIRESNDGDYCAKKLRLSEKQLEVVLLDKVIPSNVYLDINDYKTRECDLESSPCKIGIDDFSITPSGEVQPCAAFPMSFGNIKNNTWHGIVTDNPLLQDWHSCKMKEFDYCGKYDFCKCCKPCAGLNFIEHGDYRKAAETSCYMARVRYNLMERLSNGGDVLLGQTFNQALDNLDEDYCGNLHRQLYDNKTL